MAEAEPEKSRLGRVLAVIGAAVGVATLVLGVVTFWQSQPSPIVAYREQVSVVCKSAKARQVPIMSTITPQGTYDPDAYTRYVTDQVEQDRLTVDDFKKLVPPSELTGQHADAVKVGGRWITADKKYLASLGGLPEREWKKRFPSSPATRPKWLRPRVRSLVHWRP